jgi:hypothetical protein
MNPTPYPNPKRKLRWYQFSLRSLLIFVTLFGVGCSWFAVKMNQARRQRAEVEIIANVGNVHYSYECDEDGAYISCCLIMQPDGTWRTVDTPEPAVPSWLRNSLGDDFFYNVSSIDIFDVEAVKVLKNLDLAKQLKLVHFTSSINESMTDEEIKNIIRESIPNCDIETSRITERCMIPQR